MTANGFLVIAKAQGMTSMEVVRQVKRLTGEKKVGHGGTLDPIAEGVLPICFGQATRLMEALVDGTKHYTTRIKLGVTTDTFDATGEVVSTGDASGVTAEQIEAALEGFRGVIMQVPPRYSALKQGGERLYDLARAGIAVQPEPRAVEVFKADLLEWSFPELALDVECGRGVYVRSLANDLGEALGCGGHLTQLTRVRTGPFSLAASMTLEDLERAAQDGSWSNLLWPLDAVVVQLPAVVVDASGEARVRQGRPVPTGSQKESTPDHGASCRLYTAEGRFLALARFDRPLGVWYPEKVFHEEGDARIGRGRGSRRRPFPGSAGRRSP